MYIYIYLYILIFFFLSSNSTTTYLYIYIIVESTEDPDLVYYNIPKTVTLEGNEHQFKYKEGGHYSLPDNFNYEYYFNLLNMLLDQDHFQVILRVLNFIYNSMDLFHGEKRVQLIAEVLLGKHFFKLFTHWYFLVRQFFITLLVYKVFRTKRTMLPCLTPEQIQELSGIETDDNTPESIYLERNNLRPRFHSISDLQCKQESTLSKIAFNLSSAISSLTKRRSKSISNVFETSMEYESQALDLVIASKLDSFIQLICSQISNPDDKFDCYTEDKQVYAEAGLKEYIESLNLYYKEVKKVGYNEPVPSPSLDFKIVSSNE